MTATQDLSAPTDMATSLPSDGASDDIGAASDLAGSSTQDAGSPDGGVTCIAPPPGGAGPTKISGLTRPQTDTPQAAYNGSTMMVVWRVFTSHSNTQREVWATIQNGSVQASGDVGLGYTPATASWAEPKLLTFGSKFYLFGAPDALAVFNGTGWDAIAGFGGTAVAVSGSKLVGVGGATSTQAILYDGSTVSAAQKISNFRFGAVASDDAGGFGVLTVESASATSSVLHFLSYNGSAWSTESTIGTITIPAGQYLRDVAIAHSGSLWCVMSALDGSPPTAWVLSGTTWTSTPLSSVGYFVSLVGNNGTFAIATADGSVSVYSGGSWTSTKLGSANVTEDFALAAMGNGYVFAGATSSVVAAVFDGTSWSAPATLATGLDYFSITSPLMLAAGSTTAAVAFFGGSSPPYSLEVSTYAAGTWGTPFLLAANDETPSVFTPNGALVFEGTELETIYIEPGVMQNRALVSGSWGAATPLPQSTLSGAVYSAAMARAGNGHALAAWGQMDVDQEMVYAAEFDGNTWGAPTQLGKITGAPPTVAANASTFIVGAQLASGGQVTVWSGGAASTQVALGTALLQVSSDGSTFVGAWTDNGNIVLSATSSDGVTWTTPTQFDTSTVLAALAGGPAGVIEWSTIPQGTPNVSARVWHAGSWSAAARLEGAVPGGNLACHAAVASATALIVCSNSTGVDAQLFQAGSWTDLPIVGSGLTGVPFSVASDGNDYRVDFAFAGSQVQSVVLHGGAWSPLVTSPGVKPGGAGLIATAGSCGKWTLLDQDAASGNLASTKAIGAVAYPGPSALFSGNMIRFPSLLDWPGATDAFWITTPSNASPVLYVDLGL